MRDLAASLEMNRSGQFFDTGLGKIAIKSHDDMARYRLVLERHKPSLLIETGTWLGASAEWFAANGALTVISIDTLEQPASTDAVNYIGGSSVDAEVLETVRSLARQCSRVMVVLDSDHHAGHVERELECYAPLVSVGSYLVVEDTLLGELPILLGDSPAEAVAMFHVKHPGWFANDVELEDMFPTTQSPGGWLKRLR